MTKLLNLHCIRRKVGGVTVSRALKRFVLLVIHVPLIPVRDTEKWPCRDLGFSCQVREFASDNTLCL